MKAGVYPRSTIEYKLFTTANYSSGSITIAMIPEVVENDIMIIFVSHNTDTWATMPAGWNNIYQETITSGRHEAFWKRAGSGETGPYVITGISSGSAKLMAFGNCAQATSPIDAYATRINTAPTSGTAGVTTSYDGDAIVLGNWGSYFNFTPNWTIANIPGVAYELEGNMGLALNQLPAAGATGATSVALTGTNQNLGVCIALRPVESEPDLTADIIITGAPTNTSAATAYEIPSIPCVILQDLSGLSPTGKAWFKYDAGSVPAFGAIPWVNPAIGRFKLLFDCYFGPDSSSLTYTTSNYALSGVTNPIVVPVISGNTNYFAVDNNKIPAPSDQTGVFVRLEFYAAPNGTYEFGDIIINDDSRWFPAAFLDPTTGEVKGYFSEMIPAGEGGCALDNGYMLFNATYDYGPFKFKNLYLYNPQMHLVAEVVDAMETWYEYPLGYLQPAIRGEHLSKFYYLHNPWDGDLGDYTAPVLRTVDITGAIGAKSWVLSSYHYTPNVFHFAINNAETICYYGEYSYNTIHRHDLVNDVPLSDLAPAFGVGKNFGQTEDWLMMSDDTLLLQAGNNVYRIDTSDGSILNTYTFASDDDINRLALDATDDTTFWVWTRSFSTSYRKATLWQINTATGATVKSMTKWEQYSGTVFPRTGGWDASQDYAWSNSCPFFMFRGSSAPPEPEPLTRECVVSPFNTTSASLVPGGSGSGSTFGVGIVSQVPIAEQ